MESVARSISGAINGYKVVVEKSTVPVYTSDWVRKIILRNRHLRILSMLPPIRNFCAKAPRSQIFFIPTGSWLERTANVAPLCCVKFTRQ